MRNRIMFFIFLGCFSVVLFSCGGKRTEQNANIAVLQPLLQTTLITHFDNYIESIEKIPLEVTDSSFIVYIQKILLTSSKQIVILNSTGILVFDSNGKFLFRVGKVGRGPGEYLQLFDICLSADNKNILAVDYNNDVFEYAVSDGHFIRKISPSFPKKCPNCIGIASSDKNGFFLFSCNPSNQTDFDTDFFCLNQFDGDGRYVDHFLKREDYVFPNSIVTQSYDNSYIIRPPDGEHVCYRIRNGQLEGFLKIDFKEKNIPVRYVKQQPGKNYDIPKFMYSPYFKLPIYFQDTKQYLYFTCAGPDATSHYFVVDKSTLNGIHWEQSEEDDSSLVLMRAADEDYFYCVFHEYNHVETLSPSIDPLKKYLMVEKGIKLEGEDSNPLLLKIKFKI